MGFAVRLGTDNNAVKAAACCSLLYALPIAQHLPIVMVGSHNNGKMLIDAHYFRKGAAFIGVPNLLGVRNST